MLDLMTLVSEYKERPTVYCTFISRCLSSFCLTFNNEIKSCLQSLNADTADLGGTEQSPTGQNNSSHVIVQELDNIPNNNNAPNSQNNYPAGIGAYPAHSSEHSVSANIGADPAHSSEHSGTANIGATPAYSSEHSAYVNTSDTNAKATHLGIHSK